MIHSHVLITRSYVECLTRTRVLSKFQLLTRHCWTMSLADRDRLVAAGLYGVLLRLDQAEGSVRRRAMTVGMVVSIAWLPVNIAELKYESM